MAIVKAKKVEVEIQEQMFPDADVKYVVTLKYEPKDKISTEILNICLTDEKPFVRQTVDTGDAVRERDSVYPSTSPPRRKTTPEELFGLKDKNWIDD